MPGYDPSIQTIHAIQSRLITPRRDPLGNVAVGPQQGVACAFPSLPAGDLYPFRREPMIRAIAEIGRRELSLATAFAAMRQNIDEDLEYNGNSVGIERVSRRNVDANPRRVCLEEYCDGGRDFGKLGEKYPRPVSQESADFVIFFCDIHWAFKF